MRARLCSSLVLALGLAALPAWADKTDKADKSEKSDKPKAGPAAPRSDADNVTGLSNYMETLLKGNGKYLARDFAGALDIYRSAIPLAPKNALAYYLVAETQIAMGNLVEADASLKQADSTSDERNPGLRAKILFLTADVRERQKKWDDAKAGWQAYGDYAAKHPTVAFPQSATSRTQAIDEMVKQDKAYEAVRKRIADEKANAGKK
jgi:tetratricopeptide (TPR) repeat protein